MDTAHGDREFHVLWPDGAPGALGTEPVDKPKITVYRAPAGKANGAAVVVCPGGGYVVVASDHEGKQVAEWLNGLGVTAFVLQYRLGPRYHHPAPLQDAQRALGIVRQRAQARTWTSLEEDLQALARQLDDLSSEEGGHGHVRIRLWEREQGLGR